MIGRFGPAYLDRVLRVDRPLCDRASGLPWIRAPRESGGSRESSTLGSSIPAGLEIEIALPDGWPGPSGKVRCARPLREGAERPPDRARSLLERRPGRHGCRLRRGLAEH